MYRYIGLILCSYSLFASTELPDYDVTNITSFRVELSKQLKKEQTILYYKQARLYLFNNIYAYKKEGSDNVFLKDLYCNVEYENHIDIELSDSQLPDGNVLNTEHTWPKSYGFPDNNSDNYAYTDLDNGSGFLINN